ncbi:DsbE family thiol:disulfide interchange protein [Marinihelvus fidelis]|uniref:DsbE family thiol:disulfide interchange protein n=1 Tax=Marinihelvus fidelis TaxID=2613842 RepID=A0A5N0T6Q7_9GAMM|nr:DsbE family thiol:disulfide interchange protein [Marinihelvus fidelis]KAA9130562.1 DsbE family thiol:disulfide interchange protein [Marinihelvus fidelis]
MSRLVPLLLFAGLAILLWIGLQNADRKDELPSPLVGKPAPEFDLPDLFQPEKRYTPEDMLGEPWLANFWASWCYACRVEHPVIADLARLGVVRVVGMNHRDTPAEAKAWLQRHGDPYLFHMNDQDGRTSIDFGVVAAPETFLVDANGVIVFKHIGAVTPEVVEDQILPLLQRMEAGPP